MPLRALLLLLPLTLTAADWSPELAARYLDARQKEWSTWPTAASPDGACVSCHTGMTYLLARPALRRSLGEKQPTEYETALRSRLSAHAGAKPAAQLQGVEVIFATLFLTQPGSPLSEDARKSFDQLWTLQVKEGRLKGAFPWYSANLEPWETPPSLFYGTSLAALALGSAPQDYLKSPEIQPNLAALRDYLHSGLADRPLHSRLALLWASTKLPGLLTDAERRDLIAEVLSKQSADGGWTIESLGPWTEHPDAPASSGSNSYATSFASYVLLKAGVAPTRPELQRTWAWLKSHQDPKSGAWHAVSMNKSYPAGSMQESFLQDAATAFSALALIEAAP